MNIKAKGLVQVYTGMGKGKTTSSAGLALRGRAHNLKVCYIHFYKDSKKWGHGEHKVFKKIGVDVFGFAPKHPCFYKDIQRENVRKQCLKAIEFIKGLYKKNKYDILILDEILISVRDSFLKESEVLDILDSKPGKLELILTGRGATRKIIQKADLVSEIKKIKHPYETGVQKRKGIEY